MKYTAAPNQWKAPREQKQIHPPVRYTNGAGWTQDQVGPYLGVLRSSFIPASKSLSPFVTRSRTTGETPSVAPGTPQTGAEPATSPRAATTACNAPCNALVDEHGGETPVSVTEATRKHREQSAHLAFLARHPLSPPRGGRDTTNSRGSVSKRRQ